MNTEFHLIIISDLATCVGFSVVAYPYLTPTRLSHSEYKIRMQVSKVCAPKREKVVCKFVLISWITGCVQECTPYWELYLFHPDNLCRTTTEVDVC